MWAFNEYCEAPYRIFNAPYCGDDRVHCDPNITDSCPFGKACPQPPDKQCKIPPKKNQPHWLCECPYPAAQLALNWTQHVHAVAALLQNKTSIVGLWMGDEPEIGGMASDSLCAVAATMKQALHRVGRPDVWIQIRLVSARVYAKGWTISQLTVMIRVRLRQMKWLACTNERLSQSFVVQTNGSHAAKVCGLSPVFTRPAPDQLCRPHVTHSATNLLIAASQRAKVVA